MQDQKKIETRLLENTGRREDKTQERFVYRAPEMFVIGSATRLMQANYVGSVKDDVRYYPNPIGR
jgi:hypothetical protein